MDRKNKHLLGIGGLRKIFSAALVFAVAISCISIPLPSKAATVDAALLFDPAAVSANTENNVNLVARIDPGSNTVQGVNAVQLDVTFDPAVLQLSSVTASAPFAVLGTPSINNTAGTLSAALYIEGSQVTTASDAATLVFHARAAGTNSQVGFAGTANAAVNDGSGTLVVNARTGAEVTVTDLTPPVISNGAPSGQLPAGTTQKTISVSTDENATCRFSSNPGVAYDAMTGLFTTTGTTAHAFDAVGLANDSSYAYYVRCMGGSNNATVSDYAVSFSIAKGSSSSKKHKKKKKTTSSRKITNSKTKISRGQILTQRGTKFSKKSFVLLYFSRTNGTYYPPQRIMTSSTGSFAVSYRVLKPAGKYTWYAVDQKTNKRSKTISYTVR